ncbi:MAG: 50S ribosomal protein L4 [Deltaproteobacteria bacterium]|nr:50S ribosomal protein L4 [Nannocystaceae bacterium]
MAKLSVIDLTGKQVGDIEVDDAVFGAEVKEHLLWEVVRSQRAAKRRGTAKVKGRSEVNLTKDKVVKQKGSGGARHGSKRTNLYPKGGRVHGPVPHLYILHVNKKAMAGALRSVLSLRAKAGDLLVVKEFTAAEPKTKLLAKALEAISATRALLVDEGTNEWLRRTSKNLAKADFLDVRGINVYDILRYPKLIIAESAIRLVEAHLQKTLPKRAAAGAA